MEKRLDYGFRFDGCAFVDCTFPDRSMDVKNDSYKIVTSEWSQIRN